MQTAKNQELSSPNESSFVRTEDGVGFATTVHIALNKFYLSILGGSQYCYTQPEPSDDKEPTNIWFLTFHIVDAISVHAIHGWSEKQKQGGRRILLYGQAILLASGPQQDKYLRCLSYNPENGKKKKTKNALMNYHIGFTSLRDPRGADANCWFTIHPATKQRSDGEKVQAGDEIFLINVGTKRYLSLSQVPTSHGSVSSSMSLDIDDDSITEIPVATFTPCPWTIELIVSGGDKELFAGYLNGGDLIQMKLLHCKEEHFSVALSSAEDILSTKPVNKKLISFEDKSVQKELRSVWMIMLSGVKFGRAFIEWGQSFRLYHVTSGMYLGVESNEVILIDGTQADQARTSFSFVRKSNVQSHSSADRIGMGNPTIKFGDSEVYLYHISSKRWIGMEIMGPSLRRLRTGLSGPPRAIPYNQVPQNSALSLSRGMHIGLSAYVCHQIEHTMKVLADVMGSEDDLKFVKESIQEKALTRFNDVFIHLQPPDSKIVTDIHKRQDLLMKLKNRQTRLHYHGTIKMTFALLKRAVSHYTVHPTKPGLLLQQTLCKMLAAMVRGNRLACQKFVNEQYLNDLVLLVNTSHLTHAMLEVMHSLLEESPEVLCSLTKKHITSLFSLLCKNGRDEKVMKLLGSLCVCQGVAMRDQQHQICRHLMQSYDLLLHTSLQPKVYSFYANIFFNTAQDFTKWYFELHYTPTSSSKDHPPHLRIGAANYIAFQPYPGNKGIEITAGSIGDDIVSIGFDGHSVWLNGEPHTPVHTKRSPPLKRIGRQKIEDANITLPSEIVLGCCMDLLSRSQWFTLNGEPIPIRAYFGNVDDVVVVPAVSFSGGIENARLCFGENLGELKYNPPEGYAPLCHFKTDKEVCLRPFLDLGNHDERILYGPRIIVDHVTFNPSTIDVSHVMISGRLTKLIDKLAITFHNRWAISQIDAGYSYGTVTDHANKTHSNLKSFFELSKQEQNRLRKTGHVIVATLIALGCRLAEDTLDTYSQLESDEELPEKPYRQSNDFKPYSLKLSKRFPPSLLPLAKQLAETSHNAWAKDLMNNGWSYGLVTRDDTKNNCLLVPYQCLSAKDREPYIEKEKENLLTISALNYKIYPPSLDQMRDDYILSQIPFRTFRGQFASYCSGQGKWYFKVKLLKGILTRIGWAKPGFSPSSLLGSDTFSYAIDGYQACKWHNRSEKFGQMWKEGDVITCLLDLDNQIMTFARDSQLLESPSGETIAFTGFPKDCSYVPAVSVFMGGEVQLLLEPQKYDSTNHILVGYEAIEANIRSLIPLWYSDNSGIFEVITSSHSYLSLTSSKTYLSDAIAVRSNNFVKQTCLRLNMGVAIPFDHTSILSDDTLSEALESDEEINVSFSVIIPSGQNPSLVYVGWAKSEFMYRNKHFRANSPKISFGYNVELKQPMEGAESVEYEDTSTTQKPGIKYCNAYLVKLSALLEVDVVFLAAETRVDCILNVTNGHMTFTCPTFRGNDITLQMMTTGKVFPMLITDPSQENVGEFLFSPVDGCHPLAITLTSSGLIDNIPNLLPSMTLMTVAESSWYQMENNCTPYDCSGLSLTPTSSGLSLPNLPTQNLLILTVPQEERVIGFSEIIEMPGLYNYHVETLRTLKACCMHNNTDTAKQVSELISWDQFMYISEGTRWDYLLRAEYFNLLNVLYLEHEVSLRLTMQQDFIFSIESCHKKHSLVNRRGSFSQPLLNRNISGDFSGFYECIRQHIDRFQELKQCVFKTIGRLIANRTLTCRMLSTKDHNSLLIPLVTALDSFLVLRLFNTEEDRQQLLSLLHPSLGPPGSNRGFSLLTMSTDSTFQSLLCDLLDHLCDCQLQGRIDHVIKFADTFVSELQLDQKRRAEESLEQLSPQVIQEMNTPTEKQVAVMLSFNSVEGETSCPTNELLRQELETFHIRLKTHCGTTDLEDSPQNKWSEDLTTFEKLEKLVKLVMKTTHSEKKVSEGQVQKLQSVIKSTLLNWCREDIKDVKVAEKIFKLLCRQFNETDQLIQALKRTYVIEHAAEFCTSGILEFRRALGQVRMMLKIGLGEKEEEILEKMLSTLRQSEMFSLHPDLLRLTRVHTTVINVMKSYSNFNNSFQQTEVIKIQQKLRMIMSEDGFMGPVEECCKFLCAFAQTSRQNQSVLFEHIPYLLNQCIENADRLAGDTCSPLDVAIATISNNSDLVMELSEEVFVQVITLMKNMIKYGGEDEKGSKMSLLGSMSAEWTPSGSEKCLKFLLAAVWVNGETTLQNASIIIRLIIQHPECLGPGYWGQSLPLIEIFNESLSLLRTKTKPLKTQSLNRQETIVKVESNHRSSPAHLPRSRSSVFKFSLLSADFTLSFYTTLIRLFASCAIPNTTQDTSRNYGNNKYSSDHILPFLQSLVSIETLKELLTFPLSKDGMSPNHKEALLMFLHRVYSVSEPELLLNLITDVFIIDIDTTLSMLQILDDKYTMVYYFCYLCQYVLPFLEDHSYHFPCLTAQLPVLLNLMLKCYQLARSSYACGFYGNKIDSFLIKMTKTLPPQAILKFLPHFLTDISSQSVAFKTAVKVLTGHYQHYSQYYSSGMLTNVYKLAPPGQKEKVYIALLFSWLLDISYSKTQGVTLITECLEALASALLPETLVPSLEKFTLAISIPPSMDEGEDSLLHVENMELSNEWMIFVKEFAKFCHEEWVYEKQQIQGWSYAPQYNQADYKDNRMKPFECLEEKYRIQLLQPAKLVLQVLLFYGCVFNRGSGTTQPGCVPRKPKLICVMPLKKGKKISVVTLDNPDSWYMYEPSVMDLSKVQSPINFQTIAEATAEILDNFHKKRLKKSTSVPTVDAFSLESVYNPILTLFGTKQSGQSFKFVMHFLKFMKLKGLVCTGGFTSLPVHLQSIINQTAEYKPFASQLFQEFLTALETPCSCTGECCECCSRKQALFPILSRYLSCHASYFNPNIGETERRLAYATLGEKVLIARILYQVHRLLGQCVDIVFVTPVNGISKSLPSDDDDRPHPISLLSIKEKNMILLQRIISLSLSLVKAVDTSEKDVLQEVGVYFTWVANILDKFPDSIARQSQNQSSLSDRKYLLYCLHCLIPALTALFKQFQGTFKEMSDSIQILDQWPNIFAAIYTAISKHVHLFYEHEVMSSIGQCLSIMYQVYPKQRHSEKKIFHLQISHLVKELISAAAKQLSIEKTSFVAIVIAPILISQLEISSDNKDLCIRDVDRLIKLILRLVSEHLSDPNATWMKELCTVSYKLAAYCSSSLLRTHLLPIVASLSVLCNQLRQEEQLILSAMQVKEKDILLKQRKLSQSIKHFARDVASVFLFVITFYQKYEYLLKDFKRRGINYFYLQMTSLLNYWFSSQRFSIQLDSHISPVSHIPHINGIVSGHNPLITCAMIMIQNSPSYMKKIMDQVQPYLQSNISSAELEQALTQSLLQYHPASFYQTRQLDNNTDDITQEKIQNEINEMNLLKTKIPIIITFARVRQLMLQTSGLVSSSSARGKWKELMSRQRREAIIRCLKAVPFYRLKRHRAVNLFLSEYCNSWLTDCRQANMESLSEQLLDQEDYEQKVNQSNQLVKATTGTCDPLQQLFLLFKTQASTDQWDEASCSLYHSYCSAIINALQWVLETEEPLEGENAAKAYEHYHKHATQATLKQEQLLRRGVPSMILSVLAGSKGHMSSMVCVTLQLGIIQLEGGNTLVQKKLYNELESIGAEFWTSMSDLIMNCSVLDWNSYERNTLTTNTAERVFESSDQVINLFRFLQLLCEGHNEKFQNLLRTQDRNTTTVNIVIATVDYLLKLQESIRDFHWHHAHQDALELPARDSFSVAFKVARQLFRTLTEYIQGPCKGNQEALATSRLWDSMSGYLHIFVALQHKLFRHTSHIELLREMLSLQEEFFILLLSMLEGSTMSSCIGQHMACMFNECFEHLNQLITFCHIFIKLKDVTTSKAFKEYDLNKDGLISYQEFERAMNAQQNYTKQEINYLIELADTNKDGILDYQEFTERFHQPSHNLGFHLCALIRQLSDILPEDKRLKKFQEASAELARHFEGKMGCIEMTGKSQLIERVYFRVKSSRANQWEDLAIKESRKQFLHDLELRSQREKLKEFVNFCEDTIYEMNYSDQILGVEQDEKERRAETHQKENYPAASLVNGRSVLNRINTKMIAMRVTNPNHLLFKIQDLLIFLWFTLFLGIVIKPLLHTVRNIKSRVAFFWHKGEGSLKCPPLQPQLHNKTYIWNPITNYVPHILYSLYSVKALFAANYYRIKGLLLTTTFIINLLILLTTEGTSESKTDGEKCILSVTLSWLTHVHFILSIIFIFAFWHLKVPLIIFKREKEVVRRLENQKKVNGTTSIPFLDCIAIKSSSFPRHFWDKQVKVRVLNRTSPEGKAEVARRLGMEMKSKFESTSKYEEFINGVSSIIDIRYQIWRLAIVLSDNRVKYHIFYCLISLAGLRWNIFYFSILLLDLLLQSKTLQTVLRSLQINRKQLLMTLAMTGVVIYLYTVIAFNFFRKFYVHELNEGIVRDNCDTMWQCFLFHLDQGLRSGGGIADVIVSAFGDQHYFLRLFFDMTFFFVVIVILLAIFQGLIIDAFGELRKKDDTVTDELKNKCFICGLSKTEFNSPHEFDNHTKNHHSMRDYMFFLMHLIGKPETEFTGQESHVWNQYLQEQWDFFPAGTCFQLQEKQRENNEMTDRLQNTRRSRYYQPLLTHAHTTQQ